MRSHLTLFCGLCCLASVLWHSKISTVIRGQYLRMKTLGLYLNRDMSINNRDMSANNRDTPTNTAVCSHTKEFSCEQLIEGDQAEINKTVKYIKENFRTSLLPESYPTLTKDCRKYRSVRHYMNKTMTDGELQFPIAFSLLIYKHVEQVERLLRAIWRPQNVYCIHVDTKSTFYFKQAIAGISKCFDNIILLPNPVAVHWGTFTVLQPELLCMEALWKHKTKWKYFINLTGQEFPLKTNYELFRILDAYNGANDIQGICKGANLGRWRGKGKIPHNITPRKGSVHIAASRNFVDYLLHNKVSLDLLVWIKNISVPDEAYFATLNHNPHLKVPGSYNGDADDADPWTRHKIWYDATKCAGMFTRAICIFSVGDLKRLTTSPALFANKFFYEYHHLAYDCLESWYYKKIDRELAGHLDFNTTIYKNRRIVTHRF